MQIWSQGWEDLLEEGMATYFRILAWRIPWTGAWKATVPGIAKSWTQLKQLITHKHMLTMSTWILTKVAEYIFQIWRSLYILIFRLFNWTFCSLQHYWNHTLKRELYLVFSTFRTCIIFYRKWCLGWIHVHVRMSPFTVHLELSQHC